jgi:hypothetical protein
MPPDGEFDEEHPVAATATTAATTGNLHPRNERVMKHPSWVTVSDPPTVCSERVRRKEHDSTVIRPPDPALLPGSQHVSAVMRSHPDLHT